MRLERLYKERREINKKFLELQAKLIENFNKQDKTELCSTMTELIRIDKEILAAGGELNGL